MKGWAAFVPSESAINSQYKGVIYFQVLGHHEFRDFVIFAASGSYV